MSPLIDTHIHFDSDHFDHDRHAVYESAVAAGVNQMIVPATTRSRWQKILSLAEHYPHIYPTAGLHPVFLEEHTESDLQHLDDTLATGKCIAVGECGLDGFAKHLDYQQQTEFFEAQLHLAQKHQLPVIVHARDAVDNVTRSIKTAGKNTTGVIHSYNGSLQQAKLLIDLGYLLSFGGAITYSRATRLRKIVQALPLDAIMVETDAPDQTGQLNTGKRNQPAFLIEVVNTIADLKNLPAETIAAASNENAQRLFSLPPPANTDH